jgi:uncharacterized protein (UPF0332 family)
MSFDWREYLAVARFLAGDTAVGFSAEAALRAAVSRAYYAAFCHARDHAVRRLGFTALGSGQDHRNLRAHLHRAQRHRAAELLDRLHQWRKACDYDDVVLNLEQVVTSSLTRAQVVLDELG